MRGKNPKVRMSIRFIFKGPMKNEFNGSGTLSYHTFFLKCPCKLEVDSQCLKFRKMSLVYLFTFSQIVKHFLIIGNSDFLHFYTCESKKEALFHLQCSDESFTFHLLFTKVVIYSISGVRLLSILEIMTLFSFYM